MSQLQCCVEMALTAMRWIRMLQRGMGCQLAWPVDEGGCRGMCDLKEGLPASVCCYSSIVLMRQGGRTIIEKRTGDVW